MKPVLGHVEQHSEEAEEVVEEVSWVEGEEGVETVVRGTQGLRGLADSESKGWRPVVLQQEGNAPEKMSWRTGQAATGEAASFAGEEEATWARQPCE